MEAFEVENKFGRRSSKYLPGKRFVRSFFAVVLILAAAFLLLVLNHYVKNKNKKIERIDSLYKSRKEQLAAYEQCEEDICHTKNCVIAASRMHELMDTSVDPCIDFYSFACGGYEKTRALRYFSEVYTPTTEAADNILLLIRSIMEKLDSKISGSSLKKVKFLYDSCMDEKKREEENPDSIRSFLQSLNMEWPLTDDSQVQISWTDAVSSMEKFLIHTLFSPTFKPLNGFPAGKILVNCTFPLLPTEYYLQSDNLEYHYDFELYKNVMSTVLSSFGVEGEKREEVLSDVIGLEKRLAKALKVKAPKPDCSIPCDSARCIECEDSSTEVIPELSPEDEEQLRAIWRDLLDFDSEIESSCEGNLKEAMKVLNSSPTRTVLNYVGWRAVSQLMQHTVGDLRSIHNYYLIGILEDGAMSLSIWQECTEVIRRYMGYSVTNLLWLKDFFNDEHRREIETMFHDLKRAFSGIIQGVPWIDDSTKNSFLEKLMKIKFNAGYYHIIEDIRKADELYAELQFDEDDKFLHNLMKLRQFLGNAMYSRLEYVSKSFQQTSVPLEHSPLGVASRYHYQENKINMDLGLFTSPLLAYDSKDPKYLKFAATMHIARELSFAFDTTGILYDNEGEFQGSSWWPSSMKRKFQNFIDCLISKDEEFYNNSEVNKMSFINDDIADLGAFHIAYEGLATHLKNDDVELPLPGTKFHKKQVFFIQAAQHFCEIRERDKLFDRKPFKLRKDRVNNIISNMADFGAVFKCPTGSPMNTRKKCNFFY